jgi:putative FmdB family regulatory protein
MVLDIVPYHWQSTGVSASPLPGHAEVQRIQPVPTYQYACRDCGHAFEQFQSFHDDALTTCPECEGRLRKLFNAVGVVFKGAGFYRTDSRKKESTQSDSPKKESTDSGSTKSETPAASKSKETATT